MEDIIPLHMTHIKTNIGHDKYAANQIVSLEKNILKILDWDIVINTTYDLIKTFFSDFQINNEKAIKEYKLIEFLYNLEILCIFLSKLILLQENFYKYENCLKTISLMTFAFDILRSNMKVKKSGENYIKKWLFFLIKQNNYSTETATKVYDEISDFYGTMNEIKKIAPNFCILHDLKKLLKGVKFT